VLNNILKDEGPTGSTKGGKSVLIFLRVCEVDPIVVSLYSTILQVYRNVIT